MMADMTETEVWTIYGRAGIDVTHNGLASSLPEASVADGDPGIRVLTGETRIRDIKSERDRFPSPLTIRARLPVGRGLPREGFRDPTACFAASLYLIEDGPSGAIRVTLGKKLL